MIKLKQLSFANIGRFVGENVIDLESKSNLIQLDAINSLTQGSSGSGKSTIFNAIDWLFGCNSTPASILQSRLTKEKMWVSAVLEKNGQEIIVTRSKSGLSIQMGGQIFEGNVKLTEEKLNEIMGLSPDFLVKMYHKRQGENGFFLKMKPQEAHDFLSQILGVEKWVTKQENADKKTKDLQAKLYSLAAQKALAQGSYENIKKSLESLQEPSKDFTDDNLSELEIRSIELDKKYKEVSDSLLKELDLINNQRDSELAAVPSTPTPVLADQGSIKQIKAEIGKEQAEIEKQVKEILTQKTDLENLIRTHEKQIEKINQYKNQLPELQEKLSALKQAILRAKENKCPTCQQDWHGGNRDIEFERLVNQAKETLSSIKGIESMSTDGHREALSLAKKELENLLGKQPSQDRLINLQLKLSEEEEIAQKQNASALSDFEKLTAKEKAKKQEIQTKFKELLEAKTASLSSETNQIRSQKESLDLVISDIKSKKSRYEALQKQYQQTHRQLTESVGFEYGKIFDLEKQIKEQETEFEILTETSKLLKSFTSQLFKDCLNDIALKATKILNQIPNMATSTVQFESFRETQSGTVKPEINAVISMDNEIGVPIRSLSGGERSSVDIAVDLAVIDVLESIAGAGLNIAIFDEPMTGLDAVSKEQVMYLLSQHYTNKKIIIVDHSSEVKEMVNDKITVVREGQASRVQE